MTDQHRATPEQWADAGAFASDTRSCLFELRARVEALEGKYQTMRLATLEWGKALDRHDRWIDDHLKRIMALEAEQAPHILTVPGLPSSPPSSLPSRLHELTPTTLQPPLSEPAQSLLQSPCDGQTAAQP